MSQTTFIVDHATKAAREPLGAGLFGQRGSIEAHVAENRADPNGGCLSLDEFEDRYQSSFIVPKRNP